jgi:hypothetical protein
LSKLFVVLCSLLDFLWLFVSHLESDGIWDKFEYEVDWKCKESNDKAPAPLFCSKSIDVTFHDDITILDNYEMKKANGNPNTHEHWVGGNIFKDVNLIVDLSGSNHVEDL